MRKKKVKSINDKIKLYTCEQCGHVKYRKRGLDIRLYKAGKYGDCKGEKLGV